MQPPVQLLRLTKTNGREAWINPQQLIFAELGKIESKDEEKKEPGKDQKTGAAAAKKDEGFMTILHVTGKEGKIFVKEHPAEINRIILSIPVKWEATLQGK